MKKALALVSLFALPLVASAQVTSLQSFLIFVGSIINTLIPIAIGIALLVFFWGLIAYIYRRKSNDRATMITGLVGLFIMVSVWGIIRIAQNTFGLQNSATPVPAPQVPGLPGSAQSYYNTF